MKYLDNVITLLQGIYDNIGGGAGSHGMIETTYAELKDLRDNDKLIPGAQYRITDYQTIVKNPIGEIRAAQHQFDIIVTANTNNKLKDDAEAINHIFKPEDGLNLNIYANINFNSGNFYMFWRGRKCLVKDINGTIKLCWKWLSTEQKFVFTTDSYLDLTTYRGYLVGNGSIIAGSVIDILDDDTYVIDATFKDLTTTSIEATIHFEELNYFEQSNLSSWELKYTLDNDKYSWGANLNNKVYKVNIEKLKNYIINDYDIPSETVDILLKQYGLIKPVHEFTSSNDYKYISDDLTNVHDYGRKVIFSDAYSIAEYNNRLYFSEIQPDMYLSVPIYQIIDDSYEIPSEGKGVIYYMKDEYNNEAPFDFKNIQQYIKPSPSNASYYYLFGYNLEVSVLGKAKNNIIIFNKNELPKISFPSYDVANTEINNNLVINSTEIVLYASNNKIIDSHHIDSSNNCVIDCVNSYNIQLNNNNNFKTIVLKNIANIHLWSSNNNPDPCYIIIPRQPDVTDIYLNNYPDEKFLII